MARRSATMLFLAHFILLLGLANTLVDAIPLSPDSKVVASSYWMANIKRQGAVAFGNDTDYQVFRNVKDFGAKGMFPCPRHFDMLINRRWLDR